MLTTLSWCEHCDRPTRQEPVGRSLRCQSCGEWREAPVGRRLQGSVANDLRLSSER